MRLTTKQIEAIKQEGLQTYPLTRPGWFCSRVDGKQRGFTLVELVMTMVIIGILGAVVAPRFFDANVFKSRGFADQVQASLRYAQKAAIAQHRFVCAAFTNSSVTLSIRTATTCGTPLQSPTGDASYVINAPSGITFFATPTDFYFDALGKPFDILGNPRAAQDITVSGYATHIIVEAETGYVH